MPCREPCRWKCAHKKCTKLCSEPCNREPCNEPCEEKLPCGHDCIGFCGEPCPPLCRICNKKKVTKIFFGTEDEPGARFIYLEDCKHVIEAEGLANWLETQYGQSSENNSAIKLPDCPKCKTSMRRNLRFSKYIKNQLVAIEQVKARHNGTKEQILNQKSELFNYLKANENKVENKYMIKFQKIIKQVETDNNLTMTHYINLQNKWMLYFKLVEIETKNAYQIKDLINLNCLNYETHKIKEVLLKDKNEKFSEQLRNDIMNEIQRVSKLYEFFKCKEHLKAKYGKNIINEASVVLVKLEDLLVNKIYNYEKIESDSRECFNKIRKHVSGLGISDDERIMILKAMDLKQGHWYKCPNDHIYCIGECGGAMEVSRCPECKVKIGGANHALINDNAVASEMDGARHSAWSDHANMNNFDLNDLQ